VVQHSCPDRLNLHAFLFPAARAPTLCEGPTTELSLDKIPTCRKSKQTPQKPTQVVEQGTLGQPTNRSVQRLECSTIRKRTLLCYHTHFSRTALVRRSGKVAELSGMNQPSEQNVRKWLRPAAVALRACERTIFFWECEPGIVVS